MQKNSVYKFNAPLFVLLYGTPTSTFADDYVLELRSLSSSFGIKRGSFNGTDQVQSVLLVLLALRYRTPVSGILTDKKYAKQYITKLALILYIRNLNI